MTNATVPLTTIGMLLFPRLTHLDLTGPHEVLARLPNTHILLMAESLDPAVSETGLTITPDCRLVDAPPLDIVFVPGGAGINALLENQTVLDFLRQQGAQATYVTAVCTGSLVLAAAGLLDGYRATTHWRYLPLLAQFGIETVNERVVIDRNRITSGGITAGIDFSLTLAAQLHGEKVARIIQLQLEYDPAPPFQSGSPRTADPATVERATALTATSFEQRRTIIERVVANRQRV
ncbi:MAG: DJ-1/PfpI family protein [Aggregatilineales bacterium]